jgi:hypothetical protein
MDVESTLINRCPVTSTVHTFYNDYLRAKGNWPFPRWHNDKIIKFTIIVDREEIFTKLGEALI